jgi:hypothetical protein
VVEEIAISESGHGYIVSILVAWNGVFLSKRLTPWSRIPLVKLTGPQLVKKFFVFYGSRRFIAAFTSDRLMSLS